MIKQIFTAEELENSLNNINPDIFSGKIKALAEGYGFSYPFLKFFLQDNTAVIAVYYGSAVICGAVNEELVQFCIASGFSEILMPERGMNFGGINADSLNIMEYRGGVIAADIPSLSTDTPYKEVFEILRDGFDINFDDWYTDTCHNVRHGISEVFTLENKAAAQKMFTIDGISLISLVAVKKEYRGRDYGGRIIRSLSALLSRNSRVFVICEDKLKPFYEKNGYVHKGHCTQLKHRM